MLKKEKKRAQEAVSELESFGRMPRQSSTTSDDGDRLRNSRPSSGSHWNNDRKMTAREEKAKNQILGDMSAGRQEAFELFRRDYHQSDDIEDNKRALKQRYADAKSLGEHVNKSRNKINHVKSQIEQHRMQLAMQGLVDPNNPEPDDVEQEMREEMEEEKLRYKECFNKLRNLKTEIEHLQHLLEKSKVKMMKDFEMWWAEQTNKAQESQSTSVRSAWRTPTPQNHGNSIHGNSNHGNPAYLGSPSSSTLSSGPPSGRRQKVASSITNSLGSMGRLQPLPPKTNNVNAMQNGNHQKSSSGIPLTGDPKADADIMAFIKARQNILRKGIHKSTIEYQSLYVIVLGIDFQGHTSKEKVGRGFDQSPFIHSRWNIFGLKVTGFCQGRIFVLG
ncbi:hypothetical protein FSP39_020407 [Pinctada imbricata]|uniref:Kinesin-like protein KIF6/9 C-terminal domain-containing protein n=1 Tax=Pinctada imbricata TaxID=66713 RepID=A0AA88Y0Z1_PINIB|nr:hypothetical protein FSP39_020407 [Pinctada imbricata]